jgi:hypothetical protein
MVATFSWIEYNATAGDTGVPTNLNLGSTNARNLAPSTYPITAGTFSYSKWVRGAWTGSFTRIDNLQFWMSASGSGYVTGEYLLASATTASYAGTASYVAPTTNADAQAANAMPSADPGAANIGVGGSLTNSVTTSASPNNMSDFIVVQASITAAASAGPVQQKTFTLQYDEV